MYETNTTTPSRANTPALFDKKPVTAQHKDYVKLAKKWRRCRDVMGGRDAIIGHGLEYLPMLTDQTPQAYQDYLTRATFYNATWRTMSALSSMLFRRPYALTVPDVMRDMLENVNLKGEPLSQFAQQVALEMLGLGRVGLLVDYPLAPDNTQPLTVARAEQMGLRPALQRYTAESIINWRTQAIGNVDTLMLVVLTEEAERPSGNRFSAQCETHYRVLELIPDPADNSQFVYRVQVYRINERDEQEQVGPDMFPVMNGQPMRTIPFVFLSADAGLTPHCTEPPLIDLVDLNLSHFRVSADYEHGCHFTGLPTPFVTGYQSAGPQEKLYVGSTNAWVFPDPSTRVGYLEFSGAGLGMLVANLEKKEQQMAALGARLLSAENLRIVTATSAAIQHAGEMAILGAVANALSDGLSRQLLTFAQWAGLTVTEDDVEFEVNRDFFPMGMDAATLTSLVQAWQAGAISAEVLFSQLQQGEIIGPDATFEDEQAKIANAPPTVGSSAFAVDQQQAAAQSAQAAQPA